MNEADQVLSAIDRWLEREVAPHVARLEKFAKLMKAANIQPE